MCLHLFHLIHYLTAINSGSEFKSDGKLSDSLSDNFCAAENKCDNAAKYLTISICNLSEHHHLMVRVTNAGSLLVS